MKEKAKQSAGKVYLGYFTEPMFPDLKLFDNSTLRVSSESNGEEEGQLYHIKEMTITPKSFSNQHSLTGNLSLEESILLGLIRFV